MSRASEGDAAAGTRCEGFRRLLSLRDDGRLQVLELTPAQVQVYARLGDKDWREARGIPALDSGERACLAVAMDSGCAVATNDKAASKAALRLTGRPVLTSLDILQQAAERGYIRDEEIAGLIQRMARTHQHSGTTRSGI